MTSKATPAQVEALGFDKSQFGLSSGFDAYLQEVLDEVALEVEEAVGAGAYSAASGLTLSRITKAEKYFAAAELWRRIEAFERRNAYKGRGDGGGETIGSRALENAKEMAEIATAEISKVNGGGDAGGITCGHVETGRMNDAVL